MKTALIKLHRRLSRFLTSLKPPAPAMRWAGLSMILVSAIVFVISLIFMFKGLVYWQVALFVLAFGILGFLGVLLGNLLLELLMKISPFFRHAILITAFVFLFIFAGSMEFAIVALLLVVVFASVAGIGLFYLLRSAKNKAAIGKSLPGYSLLIIGSVGLLAMTFWLVHPGSNVEAVQVASLNSEYRPPLLDTSDPCEEGMHDIGFMTYGSGSYKQRNEFGEKATMLSSTVDGSVFLKGWKGMGGKLRSRYFGFDATELPLNGLVWYPLSEGTFPLILIVHGNHFAPDYSDPGYKYLGEHWASRGFVVVSVDQNFLNGAHTNIFGGLGKENDARGWLLLQHLKQWEKWNNDSINPFHAKIDFDNIALVGHSRGGEAVGHAAVFNELPFYPDDATTAFDFGFNIKAVVAIAPCDGQYKPSGIFTPLKDVSYLAIHGSHDADVRSFEGTKLFDRLKFSPGFDGFAALVYIYGANHGQFNTRWGRKDRASPMINLYNLKQLMPGEQQRTTAVFFMTAFLEAAMGIEPEYRKVFLDYRVAGDWLPETVYLTQYKEQGMTPVINYNDNLDVTKSLNPDAAISSSNLTDWYEKRIEMKFSSMDSKGVYLGWDQLDTDTAYAEYTVRFSEAFAAGPVLYIKAADSGYQPKWRDRDENMENTPQTDSDSPDEIEDEYQDDPEMEFIDFTIQLSDLNGECISFPLSSCSFMQPELEARLGKLGFLNPSPFGESILQLFYFTLENHLYQNPSFNPQQLSEITLRFDRTSNGMIVVSEAGFFDRPVFENNEYQ